jgi:hypothetical protein
MNYYQDPAFLKLPFTMLMSRTCVVTVIEMERARVHKAYAITPTYGIFYLPVETDTIVMGLPV